MIMGEYLVYVHTLPNGKRYVGMTKQDKERRWANGAGYKRQPKFYEAIQEYGWRNILHEVVAENLTEEQAREIEKEYIVDTSLPLPRNLAEEFQRGIRVDGIFYKCKSAQEINARRMKIVLIEGKNREIRNVFKSKEIGIKKLTRVRIGSVTIEGLLSGQFRELSQYEVQGLLKLCRSKAI